MLISTAATVLRILVPGDAYDCSEDADPSFWDWWATPGCEQVDSPASTVIKESLLAPWVDDARKSVSDAVKTMVTFWLEVPNPEVTDGNGGPSDVISFVTSNTLWLSALLMTLGIAVGAVKMMIDMNGAPFKNMMMMLLRYVGVASAGAVVVGGAIAIADAVSTAILDRATVGTSFTDNLMSLFDSDTGLTGALGLLIFLVIAMLLAGLQCGIMIARGGALFALLATLPVTAAASGFDTGAEGFRKQCGWIIAFIIYQPVGATIYGVGFRLIGTNTNATENGLLMVMYGISLIGLCVLALPAILRLVMPVVAPVASGRGAGGAIGGAAAMGAVAAVRH